MPVRSGYNARHAGEATLLDSYETGYQAETTLHELYDADVRGDVQPTPPPPPVQQRGTFEVAARRNRSDFVISASVTITDPDVITQIVSARFRITNQNDRIRHSTNEWIVAGDTPLPAESVRLLPKWSDPGSIRARRGWKFTASISYMDRLGRQTINVPLTVFTVTDST